MSLHRCLQPATHLGAERRHSVRLLWQGLQSQQYLFTFCPEQLFLHRRLHRCCHLVDPRQHLGNLEYKETTMSIFPKQRIWYERVASEVKNTMVPLAVVDFSFVSQYSYWNSFPLSTKIHAGSSRHGPNDFMSSTMVRMVQLIHAYEILRKLHHCYYPYCS